MAWPVSSAAAYFNPRTPVGCDTGVERILFEHGEFQSTHPSGVRRGSQGAVIQYWDISIHAPQWGATTSSALLTSGEQFQSTHPSGVRLNPYGIRDVAVSFQSTHPSGVRLLSRSHRRTIRYFNPRTPVGCDTPVGSCASSSKYFNPRTPVGCDANTNYDEPDESKFQSTHPSGVRPGLFRKEM